MECVPGPMAHWCQSVSCTLILGHPSVGNLRDSGLVLLVRRTRVQALNLALLSSVTRAVYLISLNLHLEMGMIMQLLLKMMMMIVLFKSNHSPLTVGRL